MEATKETMVRYLENLITRIHSTVKMNTEADELLSDVKMDARDLSMLSIIKNEILK